MSYLIGRGRTARETYPTSPGAGGAAAIVPLSRQRFIDGGTTAPGPGAAIAPFKTIADFIASRPIGISAQDSVANYVGWLMPSLNGYTEDVSFPPYVATELRADAFSLALAGGTTITGNLTWNNAGGSAPGAVAFLVLHNISCTGDLTITDDSGAPPSGVLLTGDEEASGSTSIGTIDSSATTKLSEIVIFNATIRDELNAGATANSAVVVCENAVIDGDVSAQSLGSVNSRFDVGAITLFGEATFFTSEFSLSSNTLLTCPLSLFDGSSWASFVSAGGTRDVGSVVLTVGGANGALVEGANLTDADVSVSLNGTGATAGFTGENSGNHYSSSVTLGGNRAVTLKTGGGESVGDTMLITRTSIADAHTLAVKNNAGTVIGTIPNSSRGFVLARYNGSDWVFVEGGSLAA